MHRDNVIYLQISDTFSCSTKTGTVARHKERNKKKHTPFVWAEVLTASSLNDSYLI